jgi:hypothetical protein
LDHGQRLCYYLVFAGYDDWLLPNARNADGTLCGGYPFTDSETMHFWLVELGKLDESVFYRNSASINTGTLDNLVN